MQPHVTFLSTGPPPRSQPSKIPRPVRVYRQCSTPEETPSRSRQREPISSRRKTIPPPARGNQRSSVLSFTYSLIVDCISKQFFPSMSIENMGVCIASNLLKRRTQVFNEQ